MKNLSSFVGSINIPLALHIASAIAWPPYAIESNCLSFAGCFQSSYTTIVPSRAVESGS